MRDSASGPHLVVIETSGNQRFIFATNRLRQNVGASELLLRSCSQWVLQAVEAVGGPGGLWAESTGERVARVRDARANPPLGTRSPAEVVYATSGRAVLLVSDPQRGREIVSRATRKALLEAPGLTVTGAVVPVELGGGREGIHDATGAANRAIGEVRGRLAPPEARFRQLPLADSCRTTGLPASVFEVPLGDEAPEEMSLVARRKYDAAGWTRRRMAAEPIRLRNHLIESPIRLDECEWLGVVHADGNGMGALLGALRDTVRPGEDHVAALREFSTAVELLAVEAFDAALSKSVEHLEESGLLRQQPIPLVPLVVGGDDLTVVCDGRMALPFTIAYLRAFEERSRERLGGLLSRVPDRPTHLSAAAGVAVVKRHYPLHAAYDLAEDLTDSAKAAKHYDIARSSFDFHVHLDSSGADLGRVRRGRRSTGLEDEQVALWGGPYVLDVEAGASPWLRAHDLARLDRAVRLLRRTRDERAVLPSTAAHRLRSALAEGAPIARAELERLLPRLAEEDRQALLGLGEEDTVVRRERDYRTAEDDSHRTTAPVLATAFVDAMDAADLWETVL